MYADMDEWRKIRYAVLREGKSKRKAQRETGMHWKTLEKVLRHPAPPGYRMAKERQKPKLGPYLKRIEDILDSDKEMPRKQRHTAKRIFERIAEEVIQAVIRWSRRRCESYGKSSAKYSYRWCTGQERRR